ncbi:hypothetical protein M758_UG302600 [Ceratodon purpureus]|nr:hypothetical protein M758_UG302600 [Ceratodon purpureus]
MSSLEDEKYGSAVLTTMAESVARPGPGVLPASSTVAFRVPPCAPRYDSSECHFGELVVVCDVAYLMDILPDWCYTEASAFCHCPWCVIANENWMSCCASRAPQHRRHFSKKCSPEALPSSCNSR